MASSKLTLTQQNVYDFIISEQPFHQRSEYSPLGLEEIPSHRTILEDSSTGARLALGDLHRQSLSVAGHLLRLDLSQSKRLLPDSPTCQQPYLKPVILVQLANCIEYGPILLGCLAAGFTASLISPALTSSELAWVFSNCQPVLVIAMRSLEECVHEALEAQAAPKPRIFFVDADGADGAKYTGRSDDFMALTHGAALGTVAHLSPCDSKRQVAVILWSSGTSGRSKPVLLSHAAVNASVATVWAASPHFTAREKWLGFTPFYHVFGLINILLLAPCCGATVYSMRAFKVPEFVSSVRRRRITFLQMAPPVAMILAKHAAVTREGFETVKGAVCGGAPLAHDIVKQVYDRLGFRICLGYGLSEACSVCLQPGLSSRDLASQAGTVGKPMYGVSLRIASVDNPSKSLPAGDEGEILIRSSSLLSCYLNNAEATAESLTSDGWFRTGDVGFLDTDGYLTITDRLKEMIKVKGFQVSPAELEGILCASNAVADAGVIGVYKTELASEYPRAYIVPSKGLDRPELAALADELCKLVEEKTASYKWLRGQVVFIERLPRSPAGKILRRMLKDTKGIEIKVYEERVHNTFTKL